MKTSKIGSTYASVLFDTSLEKNILHQVIGDFINLKKILNESSEFRNFITDPLVKQDQKHDILIKTLKKKVNLSTFNVLMLLVDRNIINYLPEIVSTFLALVNKTAKVLTFEILASNNLNSAQKRQLTETLKKLTGAKTIKLLVEVDSSIIGGLLIKKDSNIIDLTAKNELNQLAKFLNVPFYF
jgi:F-type H+-transporting ATPase subunit delta